MKFEIKKNFYIDIDKLNGVCLYEYSPSMQWHIACYVNGETIYVKFDTKEEAEKNFKLLMDEFDSKQRNKDALDKINEVIINRKPLF